MILKLRIEAILMLAIGATLWAAYVVRNANVGDAFKGFSYGLAIAFWLIAIIKLVKDRKGV